MEKFEVIRTVRGNGIVAVVRADDAEQAEKIAKACLDGGVRSIEITFTIPNASDVIRTLSDRFKNERMLIGAGTVLDSETARVAILAGANFIVSPYFDKESAKLCNRYGVPYMPGIMTVKELVSALEYGSDIVKLFPGDVLGPEAIKAFKGPVPNANLMPTGNVDLSNIDKWIKMGAVAVGVGSALVGPVKTGYYAEITERAKNFCEAIKKAREK